MNLSHRTENTAARNRNVVAVLGPTNTGKTHLAIERMLAHASGVIGLPLRLLAREVYNRIAARIGADQVALITGEEKIIPPAPRFRVCTVEAMPTETDASFLAIDEIQLAGDLERGHVFTDRLLNLRGRDETLLLGAATMRGIIEKLVPGVNVVTRPRMSLLTYSGMKKITRLPRRSAVVAFSADEVYAIAELIRRQRGGAAVVLGSLSPRTRNAQVELYQSGDVDFLVATDAIGMGLNLDVDHIAFASDQKFDGFQFRRLSSAELGQIAGRAGRHLRDGTFGVTGRATPFEDPLVEALETHRFDAVKTVQWRNRDLDFASIVELQASLDVAPGREGLTKALPSVDMNVLDIVSRDETVKALATGRERVSLLWDVCQVPDYRKIAPTNHAELVTALFTDLARDGAISDTWFEDQVAFADRTDGDIDTLANRIAHIRTWTFAANRPDWLRDPHHWQERTRAIEDRLSDALHERLTARFVDRRTSVLMRRLKENAMLEAEITPTGDVLVEGQHVGSLDGFRFAPDPNADGPEAKALRVAAGKALAGEIANRADKVATAVNTDFVIASDGTLRWQGAAVARLTEGDDALRPRLILLADDTLTGPVRDRVQGRIDLWLATHIETLLKPLFDLRAAEQLSPQARGLAFRLSENLGVIDRTEITEEVKALDQEARAGMRTLGVRFGAYHIYVPALLKPAPATLAAMLWALKNGGLDIAGLPELTRLASSGRTSVPVDAAITRPLYRVIGYRIAGNRAVRVDILERLADLIRPLIAWRPTPEVPDPPEGAIHGYGFTQTVSMTSLLGCSGEDFASVLRSLGYRMDRKPAPVKKVEPVVAPAIAEDAVAAPPAIGDVATPVEATPESPAAVETSALAEVALAEPIPEPAAASALVDAVVTETPAESAAAQVAAPVAEAEPVALAAAPAEPEKPAEPPMIEVWRPAGRRDRTEAPRHHRPQRPPRRVEAPKPAEATAADAAAPAPTEATAADAPRADRPPRHAKRDHGHERKDGDKPRGERTARPPREGQDRPRREGNDRPRRDGRDGPRREPRSSEPMRFSTEPPKSDKRDRPVDPNSPFAALAALKAELEAKERGG
jgi:ATP-dependent RNA helicase SUPV3L1/SUV3